MLQMNRTALHYAHGLTAGEHRDSIIKLLVDGKSDEEAADCRGKKPADFAELTDEISAMRDAAPAAVGADTAAAAGGEGETSAAAPVTEGEAAPAAEDTPAAADPPAAE